MYRASAIALLILALGGCRTCDNPYDYCGPVVDSGYHPAGPRAGSPGGDIIGAPVVGEQIPAPPPTPPTQPTPPTPPRDQVRPEASPLGDDLPGPSVMTRPRYAR
jgi:hypothetical protein